LNAFTHFLLGEFDKYIHNISQILYTVKENKMGWLENAAKSVGIGGDVIKVISAVDNGVADAAKAAQNTINAATQAQISAVTAGTKIAIGLAQGDIKSVEKTIRDVTADITNAVAAGAQLASSPYIVAADITRDVGGDGIKFLQGYINGQLVQINIIPYLLKSLKKTDKNPIDVLTTAPLEAILASFLKAAHEILEPKSQPLPNIIKKILKPYFKDNYVNNAKYIVAKIGFTLPEVINGTQAFMGNHAFAVTIGNVIVFSVEPDSSDNAIHWWAHEMQHTVQYKELGFDGFANKYIKNYTALEKIADDVADQVIKSLANS
jgi:hypothetical protein